MENDKGKMLYLELTGKLFELLAQIKEDLCESDEENRLKATVLGDTLLEFIDTKLDKLALEKIMLLNSAYAERHKRQAQRPELNCKWGNLTYDS